MAVFRNKSTLSRIFFRVELHQRQVSSDALHCFFEISLMVTIFFFFQFPANRTFHNASSTVSSIFRTYFELVNYKRFHCCSCKSITSVVGIRASHISSLCSSHAQKASDVEIDVGSKCYFRPLLCFRIMTDLLFPFLIVLSTDQIETSTLPTPPPPAKARAFEILKIRSFKFAPPWAKMVFKYPTI